MFGCDKSISCVLEVMLQAFLKCLKYLSTIYHETLVIKQFENACASSTLSSTWLLLTMNGK